VSNEKEIQRRFPKAFNGLRILGESYVVKLKADAKPYSLFIARNVSLPLNDKVLWCYCIQ